MRQNYCNDCEKYRPLVNDKLCRNCIEQPKNGDFQELVADVKERAVDNAKVNPDEAGRIIFVEDVGNTYEAMLGVARDYEKAIVSDKGDEVWVEIVDTVNLK